MMNITLQQLTECFPHTSQSVLNLFVVPLNTNLSKYGIINDKRISMFLAQTGEESYYFNEMEENLNYSAPILWNTFRNKFASYDECFAFAHNPQKIANRVYANEYGNGDEASGDGWTYRGRGLIGLTFKDNYQDFADYVKKSLSDTVIYLSSPQGAVEVACWIWFKRGCNKLSDIESVVNVTKKINGGLLGLETREDLYHQIRKIFPD